MSSEVLVSLVGVGKSFPAFDKPYHRLLHLLRPNAKHRGNEFQALRDVTFDVRRGEAIGIIGTNGSGKSTLLQIIAGILQPSAGHVRVDARIAALLELGAGFNPDFTGRENARLNASLHGLSAALIDARMEEMIAFAEIGEHIDQPVKTYSSGMFVRLAFAVAVHTDPELLIVDEALAVGDIYFQRKCHKRIEAMRQDGCTLLFVSHAVDSLLQLCDRCLVLESGRLVFDGECKAAVAEYLKRIFGDNSGRTQDAMQAMQCEAAQASGQDPLQDFLAEEHALERFTSRPGYNRDETRLGEGSATTCDFLIASPLGYGPVVSAREDFKLYVKYTFHASLDRLVFGMRVRTVGGAVVYSSNTFVSGNRLYTCAAGSSVIVEFDLRCSLLPGQYFVTVGVSRFDANGVEILAVDRRSDAIVLNVLGGNTHAEGLADLEASIFVTDAATRRALVVG